MAAGNYDSDALTTERCTRQCGLGGYGYAALKQGNQCFCASAFDTSSNSKSSDAMCIESCTGNVALKCGGEEHYSVYKVNDTFPTTLEISAPTNTSTFAMMNISLTKYPGATYTLDFGGDTSFEFSQHETSVFFYNPGRVSIYAETETAEYTEPRLLRAESQVDVYSHIVAHHGCPQAVEVGEQAFCTVTACMGSEMKVKVQFHGHAPVEANMEGNLYVLSNPFSDEF